jgi:hypothetical protein
MDPIKILKRAWTILWNYRALWAFGLILALATAGSTGNGSNNGMQFDRDGNNPPATSQTFQEVWSEITREIQNAFREGIPDAQISGEALTAFLWVLGGFVLLMVIIGILVAIARYVSEVAVIRMVDEYEASGTKMTVREGFRLGWSNAAWRLFLINLIISLPAILLMLTLIGAGIGFYFSVTRGNGNVTALSTVTIIGFVFLLIFTVVIVSIVLRLLRNFFWRISVLEGAGVRESLRRGVELVRENWKNVGLMWLVMIGLGIVWAIASILLFIITLPVVVITAILAAVIVAVPFMLALGAFSLVLSGPLTWVAAGLFILPLFFTLAFSPWLMLGSWQAVYTSTVWTLTYRELRALPAPASELIVQPAGD